MGVAVQFAPAIVGLRSKARYNRAAEERAVHLALRAVRGTGCTLPVMFGNRIIAWVRGHSHSPKVELIGSLNDIINATTVNGQWLSSPFCKIEGALNLTTTKWYDLYPMGPCGGTYPGAAATAVQLSDLSPGAIPHGGNVSPALKTTTGGWLISNLTGGIFMLYDRVLDYQACPVTGVLQNMTNTLAAQRYISGGQQGLRIMPTAQTLFGGGANVSALVYTNQAGTASQTVPVSPTLALDTTIAVNAGNSMPAQLAVDLGGTAAANVLFLPLAIGDTGVRSIASYTTSAAQTGKICFSLVHPIAFIVTQAGDLGGQADFLRQTAMCEQIFDGASLHLVHQSTIADSVTLQGAFDFVWS